MMKTNIFYNILYQLVNMLIPIITAPYLSRTIGASGVGLNSYTKAIAGYFIIFAMQGLNQYGSREIALVKDSPRDLSKKFWEIYCIQFLTSFFVIFLYVIYSFTFMGDDKIALQINFFYVLSALFDINWFYFGVSEFKLTTIRNFIIKFFSMIMIFVFIKSEEDIFRYIMISSFSFLLSNIVLWFYLKKYIVKVRISLKESMKHIKPNFVLFIAILAISVYKLMDKIMLGRMSDVAQNGYYENMSNIVTIPLSVITAMGTVMLPKISELVKKDETEKVSEYNQDTVQIMLGLSLPFTVGMFCVADRFVPLYFGEGFRESAIVLKLLVISSPFIAFANVIRTQCIIPLKKDNIYVQATIIGAGLNFAINYLLIPIYGAKGAAIGTVAAEVAVSLYQYIRIRYAVKNLHIVRYNLVFLISSIIMGKIISVFNLLPIKSIFVILGQVFCGIIFYFSFISIFFYKFENERFKHWEKILSRRK